MPDKADPKAELEKQLKETFGLFLNAAVRVHAVQMILERKGYVTRTEVDSQIEALNDIPGLKEIRTDLGMPSLDIEALLRPFEGTIQ